MKDIFDFEEFMMTELFDEFPCLENDKVMIRKMELSDVVACQRLAITTMFISTYHRFYIRKVIKC